MMNELKVVSFSKDMIQRLDSGDIAIESNLRKVRTELVSGVESRESNKGCAIQIGVNGFQTSIVNCDAKLQMECNNHYSVRSRPVWDSVEKIRPTINIGMTEWLTLFMIESDGEDTYYVTFPDSISGRGTILKENENGITFLDEISFSCNDAMLLEISIIISGENIGPLRLNGEIKTNSGQSDVIVESSLRTDYSDEMWKKFIRDKFPETFSLDNPLKKHDLKIRNN